MGLVRQISALVLVVTLSVIGIPFPAHAGEESPPLTLNGHPLSQLLNRAAPGDPFRPAGLLKQETGQISGVLLDEDGQQDADQRVELDSSEGPLRLVETTDASGAFSYTQLDPCRYEVQHRVDGEVVASSGPLDLNQGAMQVSGVTLAPAEYVKVARSFQGLGSLVEAGTEVSVIDVSGNGVVGDVVDISASTLTVSADGNRREFQESEVLRVTRPPHGMSRLVGGLLGAGAGFLVLGAVCAENLSNCDDGAYAAFLVGGGAAAGGFMTGRTDEQLLFRSPTSVARASPTVSVAPMVAKTVKGARLAIGW